MLSQSNRRFEQITQEDFHSLETADTLLLSSSIIYSLLDVQEGWLNDLPLKTLYPSPLLTKLFSSSEYTGFENEVRDTRLQQLLLFGEQLAAARPILLHDVIVELEKAQFLSRESEQAFLSRIQTLLIAKKNNQNISLQKIHALSSKEKVFFTFSLNSRQSVVVSFWNESKSKESIINLSTLFSYAPEAVTFCLVDLCVSRAKQKDFVHFKSVIEQEQKLHRLYKPFGAFLLEVLASSLSIAGLEPLEQLFIALQHIYTVTWDDVKEIFLNPVKPFILELLTGNSEDTLTYINQVNCIEHLQTCLAFPPEKRAFFHLLRKFPRFLQQKSISEATFPKEEMGGRLQAVVSDPSLFVPELITEEELEDRNDLQIMSVLENLRECPIDELQSLYERIIQQLQLTIEEDALSYSFIETLMKQMYQLSDSIGNVNTYRLLTAFIFQKAQVYFPSFQSSSHFGYQEALAITALRVFDPDNTKAFSQKVISSIEESIDLDIVKRRIDLEEREDDRSMRRAQLLEVTDDSEGLISADSMQLLYAFHKLNFFNESGDIQIEKYNILYGLYTLYVSGIISPQILSFLVRNFIYKDESSEIQMATIDHIYAIAAKSESSEKKALQQFLLKAYQLIRND